MLPALALVALAVLSLRWLLGRGHEVTDDAQIEGRVIPVGPRTAGQVTKVMVTDNQLLNVGDPIIELDTVELQARLDAASADVLTAKAALGLANAQLELTVKEVGANLVEAKGSEKEARATLQQSYARWRLAQKDYERATELFKDNSVSQSEVDAKRAARDVASASLDVGGLQEAKGRVLAAQAGPQKVALARAAVEAAAAHVKEAEAAERLAELNLGYAVVRSPIRGVVSRRSAEVGTLVNSERPIVGLVPLDDIWIVANFKEDQLREMHPGAKAVVTTTTYGRRKFFGHVESVAPATGARTALIPPDNASGNFIRVVQRVPVLIRLESKPDVDLRPGMSCDVDVDTRH